MFPGVSSRGLRGDFWVRAASGCSDFHKVTLKHVFDNRGSLCARSLTLTAARLACRAALITYLLI